MQVRQAWRKRFSALLVSLVATMSLSFPAQTAEDVLAYYDNTSSSVVHTGSWTVNGSGWPRAYNSSISYTNATNAKVSLSFYGNSITRIYTKASNRGLADIYIDGGFKETMNDATPSGTPTARWQAAKTWTVPTGAHTIEVRRITGYVDADAFISDITTVGNGTYDTDNSQIKYIGSWSATNTSFTASYGSTLKWTNTAENAVSFTFVGSSITYIYTKALNRGKAAVTIDGVDKGLIDLYSSTAQFQQGTTYNNLGAGVHTIQIAATNQKNSSSSDYYIDVDAFNVGAVYNRTAAVSYADTWAHARNSDYPNYGDPGDDPCNDCTNFISQVLEAGGIPRIFDIYRDDSYVWYIWHNSVSYQGSKTWAATDWFKNHVDTYSARYQFIGTLSSNVTSLSQGDFILMDLADDIPGVDHTSIAMGWGNVQEGDEIGQWRFLRNAHCTDRKRVKWDYGLVTGDTFQAYKVTY